MINITRQINNIVKRFFNTFIQNNVNLTFGSDWDVTPLNPLEGIYAAVSRKTLDGSNPDGWYPEQKISIFEAIKCYTKNNAYAGFQEKKTGILKEGFYADFTVLSEDLTSINIENILEQKYDKHLAIQKSIDDLSNWHLKQLELVTFTRKQEEELQKLNHQVRFLVSILEVFLLF